MMCTGNYPEYEHFPSWGESESRAIGDDMTAAPVHESSPYWLPSPESCMQMTKTTAHGRAPHPRAAHTSCTARGGASRAHNKHSKQWVIDARCANYCSRGASRNSPRSTDDGWIKAGVLNLSGSIRMPLSLSGEGNEIIAVASRVEILQQGMPGLFTFLPL